MGSVSLRSDGFNPSGYEIPNFGTGCLLMAYERLSWDCIVHARLVFDFETNTAYCPECNRLYDITEWRKAFKGVE
jgi:hypothetical protein